MSHLHFTTKHLNATSVEHKWYIIDAKDKILGRLSSKVASVLMGKNKPYFSNHLDCGDYVIVINAAKVKLSGNRLTDKTYIHYSGYPGGQKETSASLKLQKHPEFLVEAAVKGMLPKTRLGRQMFKKIFVYAGDKHPHQAQTPQTLEF